VLQLTSALCYVMLLGWYRHIRCSSDRTACWFLTRPWRFQLVRSKALRKHRKAFFFFFARFKNDHSECSYKCTLSTVNVFWKRYNAAWPFRGEPSSDQAVRTAAMCGVRGWASYPTTLHAVFYDTSYNYRPSMPRSWKYPVVCCVLLGGTKIYLV